MSAEFQSEKVSLSWSGGEEKWIEERWRYQLIDTKSTLFAVLKQGSIEKLKNKRRKL